MQTASTLHIFLLNPQKANPCLVWAKDEETAKKDAAEFTGGSSKTATKSFGDKGLTERNLGDKSLNKNASEKSTTIQDKQMKSGSDIGGKTATAKTECQCKELQFNKDYKVVQELGSDRVEIEYKNQKITLAKDIAKPIH